jgi:hypothetical protein
MKTITLDHPFKRGETEITEVQILQPEGTGWLRGAKMVELIQMDADLLVKVLPRITSPALTEQEIRTKLHPADLFQMGGEVSAFLLPKSVKEQADAPSE